MNIKRSDKILIILIILLIAAALVFRIGFRSGGNSQGGAAKTEKVNLVFTQPQESEWDENLISSLIEEYETLHPEVSIRWQPLTYNELRDARTAIAAADTAGTEFAAEGRSSLPDIIVMEGPYLAEFIEAETFRSLAAYLPPETPIEEWALPLVSSMDVLFYNIDILKAAGFDRPPRDRREFLRYAQAVSNGNEGPAKKYGAALALGPAEIRGVYRDVFSWIWAAGARLIRDGAPDLDDRQVKDTLAFLAQLNREGCLAPQSFIATGAERLDEFAAGKIAMMTGSVQDIARVREGMEDGSFGVTLIPGPAGYAGKPIFGLSVWYAGISRRSEHPDEARNFLFYLREKGALIAEQIRAVPGSNGQAAPYITEDPFYAKVWDMYEAADLVQELAAFPKTRELENAVREELVKLFAENPPSP
ncbi:sugar ABC transporter substrate-binding protein [Spirochaetia bacterium]|nr:sugar ABC transporter substrate-binding protein [Spirochaetia bacterium]